MQNPLDNIFWNSLTGAHAAFSAGAAEARRYAKGFSPILGFANPQRPNFAALIPYCDPDEHFYCDCWSAEAGALWHVEAESTMFRMAWDAPAPELEAGQDSFTALGSQHAAQAMALASLTKPGPFGPRTIELGEYFGLIEDGRLVAMAGERARATGYTEISGVCTHPDFQGRGLARRLMEKLIRRQLQRGETPFLHVMRDNVNAHRLYERMGFRDYMEPVVRVVSLRA